MTKNSWLCSLIAGKKISVLPELSENYDWRQVCEHLSIKVKEEGGLAIFNYDMGADFYNPVVQEARGIIIDIKKCEVVCWPFRKFGNSYEPYADKINWDRAVVQEKVDGSIIKLFYNKLIKQWQIASNSCINADTAVLLSGYSVGELVRSTAEYENFMELVQYDMVNKNHTYIFELVSPKNQIVIKYDKTMLYLLGVRSNLDGQEYDPVEYFNVSIYELVPALGCFPTPRVYCVNTLEGCIKAAEQLNKGDYPDLEGFVVVDNFWRRIKVKSPQYLMYHHIVNNGRITKERAWDVLTSDDFNMSEFVKMASEDNVKILKYYQEEFAKAKEYTIVKIKEVLDWQKAGLTRKEIALRIKDDPAAYFCFKALSSDQSIEQIIMGAGNKLIHQVKDYELKK